jgi:hypothetical protein
VGKFAKAAAAKASKAIRPEAVLLKQIGQVLMNLKTLPQPAFPVVSPKEETAVLEAKTDSEVKPEMAEVVCRVRAWQSEVARQALLVQSLSKKLEAREELLASSEGTAAAAVKQVRKEANALMRKAAAFALEARTAVDAAKAAHEAAPELALEPALAPTVVVGVIVEPAPAPPAASAVPDAGAPPADSGQQQEPPATTRQKALYAKLVELCGQLPPLGARPEERPAPETAQQKEFQTGDLVIVSCEQATKGNFGRQGSVHSVDKKAKTVTFLPEAANGPLKVVFPMHQLVQVSKFPHICPQKKPANWLSFAEYGQVMEHWNFLPFEEAALDETKLMDSVDLEVGALELLWRVLPPATLTLPVQLPCMLRHGAEKDEPAVAAGFEEQLRARADRARCLLCPIFQSDHFTLLVLERWGATSESEANGGGELKPAQEMSKYTAFTKSPAQEAHVFNQLSTPPLAWVSAWEVTYYDSARVEYSACRDVAKAVLVGLGMSPDDLPARKNNTRQNHLACGFWTLYWMEEHARRQRGEPSWTAEYNLAGRIDNMTKFKKRLQEHQKKADELQKQIEFIE